MSSLDRPELPLAIRAEGDAGDLERRAPRRRSARLMLLDLVTYMPGSVLAKVDRASMAHGLEVRPPFLDNDIAGWALSLPSSYKVRRDRGKFLLKLAAKGKLPEAVIERPKKGFGIPLAAWLRGPLHDRLADVLKESPVWDTGALNHRCSARKTASIRRSKKDKQQAPMGDGGTRSLAAPYARGHGQHLNGRASPCRGRPGVLGNDGISQIPASPSLSRQMLQAKNPNTAR